MGTWRPGVEPLLHTPQVSLYVGDCFNLINSLPDNSIDMIFADPPYFLSNGGITCQGGKAVSVDKGDWDKIGCLEEKHDFNRHWIRYCRRVLKKNGSIWISGTLHNIYSVGMALEQEKFKIINNITWQKTNPPPNLACRCFTHSTETILWAQKNDPESRHLFNYELMKQSNGGKQMKDVWTGSLTPTIEKKFGRHPTQKPLYILNRIVLASTKEGDLILDPFCGSGTTGVAALTQNRRFLGFDVSEKFLQIAKARIESIL